MELQFIHWIEHAGFRIEGDGKNVYIDPFKLSKDYPKADVIFITHPHFDHLDIESIERIADSKTQFIVASGAEEKLGGYKLKVANPGDSGQVAGVAYRAMPAYNNKKDRTGFHPKENGWLGYVVVVGGKSVYHAGDTDVIDEMAGLKVDVALLPIGGTYTMDVKDAVRATLKISADTFVPMHYRAVLGKNMAAAAESDFCIAVKNAKVLEQEQDPSFSF